MKQTVTDKTMQPLADDDLEQANGGVWRNFADIQIQWHCYQCGESSIWYTQTERDQFEATKTEHANRTGHICFEDYRKR